MCYAELPTALQLTMVSHKNSTPFLCLTAMQSLAKARTLLTSPKSPGKLDPPAVKHEQCGHFATLPTALSAQGYSDMTLCPVTAKVAVQVDDEFC